MIVRIRNRPTAALVTLIGLIVVICSESRGDVVWRTDFAVARKVARRAGKPLLVDFSATWCGPCRDMDRTTFQDRGVVAQMARCVCVRVDIDRDPGLAKHFGVNSIPRVVAMNSRGKRVLDSLGYRDPAEFRTMLAYAFSGKPVLESGEQPDRASPDIRALESHLRAKDYASWRTTQPAVSEQALRAAVEQLGAFDADDRAKAVRILGEVGGDGIQTLIFGLSDAKLGVRVGAYDTLMRFLTAQYRAGPASFPQYDPWAASAERARMAQAVRQWWGRRRVRGVEAF